MCPRPPPGLTPRGRPHRPHVPAGRVWAAQRPPLLQADGGQAEEGEPRQDPGRGHGRGGGQMTKCGELRVIEVCRYFARVKYLYICFHCESLFHCTPLYILKV